VKKKELFQQWLDNLPQLKGRIKIFIKDGHFIQETGPVEVANNINKLLKLA
jgi:hypothetical protein